MAINRGKTEVKTIRFGDGGDIPNNPTLPLVILKGAFARTDDLAADIEEAFVANGWEGTWRDGVFAYHHFHSNAHEALGCFAGSATIRFGGESGESVEVEAGDVAILPAGTGHKRIESSSDFGVVGAYPPGQGNYDLHRSVHDDRDKLLHNIQQTKLPDRDPVFGESGPLMEEWS